MSTEQPVDPQVSWSPDDLPASAAKALQDKEEARAKRAARKAATALVEPVATEAGEAAPVKKRRGRPPKKAAVSEASTEAAAPVSPEKPVSSETPAQSVTASAPAADVVPNATALQSAPAVPAPSAPAAVQPQQTQPQIQQQATLPPEGPQQPLSKRQLRRQQWLANRAARNGNRLGNFNGNGNQNGGNGSFQQGNRRPFEQRHQQDQRHQQQRYEPPPPSVPRNPDLPEFRLQDIHTWDNGTIVERMMPDANAEDLGAMKRHEIIFAAIRNYLNRGGAVTATGCLKVEKEGYGFLRSAKTNFLACPEDVFIPQQQIRRHALRTGDIVEGPIRDPRDKDRYFVLGNVVSVNGKTPSEAARIVHFENLTPTFPTKRIVLETTPGEFSTRVVDLFTPIGFGQRGLIVAPPRVGKTVLLQKMANAITKNHPDAILIVLLVDERPEEVTDMQRNTRAMVLSSTFDEEPQHHVDVAEMVIEMSRRQAENGKDVIILLDSITRLARAYNTVQPHSGKILTGGVDALALHRPKRFFGAARNIEGGGSLTILATALIDTGSRMDEVIFEEFKGTG
ncbi:MAG: transcription termination factor Rho, partial [bacterium]|nr:transcription termination factor Rho [bacterium]